MIDDDLQITIKIAGYGAGPAHPDGEIIVSGTEAPPYGATLHLQGIAFDSREPGQIYLHREEVDELLAALCAVIGYKVHAGDVR